MFKDVWKYWVILFIIVHMLNQRAEILKILPSQYPVCNV